MMSDNPEYKYDGDEQNDIYEAVQEVPTKRSLFQNPKLILFIALIVVLYVAGFIASNYQNKPVEKTEEVPSPITQKAPTPETNDDSIVAPYLSHQ